MNSQPASQPDSIDLAYDMWAGQFEFIGPTATNGNNSNNSNNSRNRKNLNNNNSNSSSDKNSSQNRSTESLEDLNLNLNFNTSSSSGCGGSSSTTSLTTNGGYYGLNCSSGGGGGASFDFSKQQPILIDQETFLSLNPNDFDEVGSSSSSGPNSLVFIENKLIDGVVGGLEEISSSPTSCNGVSNNTNNHNINNNHISNNNNNNNSNNHNNNNNSISSNSNNSDKIVNIEALTNKFNCKPNNTNTNGFKLENLKNFKNKLLGDFDFATSTSPEKSPAAIVAVVGGDQINSNSGKMNGISAEICDNFNEQLELLQRQVTDLADTQNIAEDRTTRTKTEYAVLQARYHMLEEQYRESEIRSEERLAEEQKRNRELLARVEREASLQNENCQIKIKTIEIEANALREEAQRLRILCDKQASDLHNTEEKLELARDSIAALQLDLDEAKQRERKHEVEKKAAEDLMVELSGELERMRYETGPAMPTTSPETLRLEELHQELNALRQKNKNLEEQNEELQAAVLTRGVEEGRHLLNGTLNSLAQELEEMSQAQLQQAFQEKEDENVRLKHYIDTILLNIVENYPQLLEVKAIQRN